MKLFFTTGSPFARAVRIVLAEKGLSFLRDETYTTPSVEERAKVTPTLQVPTLIDGELKLWDLTVIVEYLMMTYPNPQPPDGTEPFAVDDVRQERAWQDKIALATLQTFGGSIVTISQLEWGGIRHEDNTFASRCAERVQHLLNWFEGQVISLESRIRPRSHIRSGCVPRLLVPVHRPSPVETVMAQS